MLRTAACLVTLLTIAWAADSSSAQVPGLMSQPTAERHGMRRAWFAQIDVDRASGKIQHATLDRGVLFVQTNRSMIHAIHAESGRTLWSSQVGRRNHPSLPPAANADSIAVVNGSMLYVCDRGTGRLMWERALSGVPGAGPVLSAERVFVPMIDGTIEGFKLKDTEHPRWMYRSEGRVLVQPVTTRKDIAWTTDDGFLYVASATEPPTIRFRMEAGRPIESRASYWPPHIFACSLDGFVYAVNEESGLSDWRFSTGSPIYQPPAALGDRVFVLPERTGIYCLNTNTGRPLWFAAGASRFLGASPTRVYALDRSQQMLVLSMATGAIEDVVPAPGVDFTVINSDTDRLYFGTQTGIVQCLHEAELTKPVVYTPPVIEPPATEQPGSTQTPRPMPSTPPAVEDPTDPSLQPQELPDDGMPAEQPAADEPATEEPAAEDDPFGGLEG